MTRISLLAAGLAVGLVFAAPAAPTGAMAPTKLKGVTGPGFTITLKKAGTAVRTLKAASTRSPFRTSRTSTTSVSGGLGSTSRSPTLAFRGTKTVTVTLKKGTYSILCDPHVAQGMIKRFKVT